MVRRWYPNLVRLAVFVQVIKGFVPAGGFDSSCPGESHE